MSKEITPKPNRISVLAQKQSSKEITQGKLDLEVEKDVGGIGMGVLSDGTPYLNQRGLAALCGVQNAHIGSISGQWNDAEQKPRVAAIKSILNKANLSAPQAHIEIRSGRCRRLCPNLRVWHQYESFVFHAAAVSVPSANFSGRKRLE